ncbi:TonB-dependent receptor [Pedobacter sp. MC2016-14]|uniref:TonB-dependent receptor n=1 Tax=Pedobacter sp. MC2016-14 TaxID=2897327 RepID=UPI001E335C78|nr:TonB-dependent receptor [Pedobacter sp. MC2016-14]MCD0488096.1 TonB-dependent receptor [Pedobacter sp. MC2016-14]
MYKNFTTKSAGPSGHIRQIYRVMRITTIFMFGIMMQVAASSSAQKISINKRNADLESVFKSIREQSGYDFVFDLKVMETAKPVTVNLRDVSVSEVLDVCFANQMLTYAIEDKTVMVSKKSFVGKILNYFQSIDVSGKVLDESGNPLPGVSIRVKGTDKVILSRANGGFYLNVENENAILVFSFVGYKTKELNARAKMEFRMETDPAKLDEVMVIGYGTTTKRVSTGSQTGITAKDIERQPVTNVLQALQGRMPGVAITQTNGLPGAGINVQIRGINSIGKGNVPLYIIDGVPFLSTPISGAASVTGTPAASVGLAATSAEGQTSPMNIINPSDIESIDVLKDADATAIYGSRGANGVILITTKKGRAGKTQFSVNANTGMSKVANYVELLSTDEYLALRRKAFANNPAAVMAGNVDLTWDPNVNQNFPKILLGNTARTHDITSNISGGDVLTNFYLSGTFHRETNIYPGEQAYQRGGAHLNFNHSSSDQKFSLSVSSTYSADQNDITITELANYAYVLPPNFPLYNADGSLYFASGFNNPLAFLLQSNDARGSNFVTNLGLKYTIIKGLNISSTLGYGKTDMRTNSVRPLASYALSATRTSGSVIESYVYSNNYIFEPQLTYKSALWKGNLEALVAGSWQFRQSKIPYSLNATDFLSDDFLSDIGSARTKTVSSGSNEYKYASVFGRLNYNVLNKYIANMSFRRDGSSRFGPNNRFGNFGAVGAAWVFSEENLLKNKFSWFSFGKLRGSYGIVGSDEIGNYAYYDSYTSDPYVYNGSTGLQPSRLANNNYKWEETKKLEVAIELGFFKDRLSLTAATYRNRTSNQLLEFPISTQAGFPGFSSNLGAVLQNSGTEFSLNSTNIQKKDFKWTSAFNISKNRNKLVAFPNIEKTAYYTRYVVGKPLSVLYALQFAGMSPTTGLPTYADLNGSGTISTGFVDTGRGDQYYVGTAYPKFFGGLTNSITYKGINLDFTFQFVKQLSKTLIAATNYPPGYPYNAAASVMRDYLALGSQDQLVTQDARSVQGSAAYTAFLNYALSDQVFVDASFIKLKNASLSYAIPAKLLSKINAQNLRVYVQGQNLFTITKYKGYDPESQGAATPPLRTISAGLQLTF